MVTTTQDWCTCLRPSPHSVYLVFAPLQAAKAAEKAARVAQAKAKAEAAAAPQASAADGAGASKKAQARAEAEAKKVCARST